MGLKKILKRLAGLQEEGAKKGGFCSELDDLIGELKKKQRKVGNKLDEAKESSDRKKLGLELKIIKAALKRAEKQFDHKCR